MMAAAKLLDLYETIVPRNVNEKVQECNVINKLTTTLLEYQTPQRAATQNAQAKRAVMAPTDSHDPTARKAIRTAPRVH